MGRYGSLSGSCELKVSKMILVTLYLFTLGIYSV